jgi:hypothetical protein
MVTDHHVRPAQMRDMQQDLYSKIFIGAPLKTLRTRSGTESTAKELLDVRELKSKM